MDIDNKKCYNCGKVFRTPAEYNRHKNRKTPCLIRDVSEEDRKNPNRCIYCNKILSKKEHLTRHLAKCKVKNGGMQTLYDKVKYDEGMRILKEEHQQEIKALEQKFTQQDEKIKFLEEQLTKLISSDKQAVVVSNTTNNTTNNINTGTNISIGQVVINDYNKAKIDHLAVYEVFSKIFNEHWINTPIALVEKIWFDPNHPENISIHLVNKKNGEMLVMKGNRWVTENSSAVIPEIKEFVYSFIIALMKEFDSKMRADRIIRFENDHIPGAFVRNRIEDCKWENDEFFKKILDGRIISSPAISLSGGIFAIEN